MASGFQQDAFQGGAFQTGAPVVIEQFGWAIVTAVSQTGIQAARSAFIEQSACFVTASYFDISGDAFTPSAVSYSVWDVNSGASIVSWTSITPAETNQVTVTSVQNSLISFSRWHEAHQVLFEITDGYGDVNYARVVFDLNRVLRFSPTTSGGFQDSCFQSGAFQD